MKNTKEEYEAKIGYFQKQVAELKNEKENYSGIVKKQSSVSIILCSKCNWVYYFKFAKNQWN